MNSDLWSCRPTWYQLSHPSLPPPSPEKKFNLSFQNLNMSSILKIFSSFRSISVPGSIPASPKDKMRVDATTTSTTPGTAESSSFSDLLSETVSYATSQARYYFFATPEEIEEDKEQVFLLPLTIFACFSV